MEKPSWSLWENDRSLMGNLSSGGAAAGDQINVMKEDRLDGSAGHEWIAWTQPVNVFVVSVKIHFCYFSLKVSEESWRTPRWCWCERQTSAVTVRRWSSLEPCGFGQRCCRQEVALTALLAHVCGSCDIPAWLVSDDWCGVAPPHCLRLTCHSRRGISRFSRTVSGTEEPLLWRCLFYHQIPVWTPEHYFISPFVLQL